MTSHESVVVCPLSDQNPGDFAGSHPERLTGKTSTARICPAQEKLVVLYNAYVVLEYTVGTCLANIFRFT